VADRRAIAQLRRLMPWLESFKECFGHHAQQLALRPYVQGLLSDSDRKSMEAMLARVTEPGSYQTFQHFITHAPWSAPRVAPSAHGAPGSYGRADHDATTSLKHGHHSVGVTRQYSGLQGQIVNCQAAVTAALWSEGRAFLVGAALYLPQSWLIDAARTRAHIPTTVRFQEKWRLALTLLRQVRASGIRLTGVLADADFGDKRAFRGILHRLRLPYSVGVSTHLTAFRGIPRLTRPRALPGFHQRRLAPGVTARPIAELIATERLAWRRVQWRNRPGARTRRAECAAMRVTPAIDPRQSRLSPETWLTRRARGRHPAQKHDSSASICRRARPSRSWCVSHTSAGQSSSSIKNSSRSSAWIISRAGPIPAGSTMSY
jgi:SRSO17 transposase